VSQKKRKTKLKDDVSSFLKLRGTAESSDNHSERPLEHTNVVFDLLIDALEHLREQKGLMMLKDR